MRKITLLLICLSACLFVSAQRKNKRGEYLVSEITISYPQSDKVYGGNRTKHLRYSYDEECNLIHFTVDYNLYGGRGKNLGKFFMDIKAVNEMRGQSKYKRVYHDITISGDGYYAARTNKHGRKSYNLVEFDVKRKGQYEDGEWETKKIQCINGTYKGYCQAYVRKGTTAKYDVYHDMGMRDEIFTPEFNGPVNNTNITFTSFFLLNKDIPFVYPFSNSSWGEGNYDFNKPMITVLDVGGNYYVFEYETVNGLVTQIRVYTVAITNFMDVKKGDRFNICTIDIKYLH